MKRQTAFHGAASVVSRRNRVVHDVARSVVICYLGRAHERELRAQVEAPACVRLQPKTCALPESRKSACVQRNGIACDGTVTVCA